MEHLPVKQMKVLLSEKPSKPPPAKRQKKDEAAKPPKGYDVTLKDPVSDDPIKIKVGKKQAEFIPKILKDPPSPLDIKTKFLIHDAMNSWENRIGLKDLHHDVAHIQAMLEDNESSASNSVLLSDNMQTYMSMFEK